MPGTSASFTPPQTPACAYAPRMTRAQAQALQTAAGLSENCVVVITDGPVIGVAGSTSATEIELNPVSPTELGRTARIHTAFSANAFEGQYSIANGTITEMTDNLANHVLDPTGAIIGNQFPWGFADVRANEVINDNVSPGGVVLTGWGTAATAGALIQSNDIQSGDGATLVDLTNLGGTGVFLNNTIHSGTVKFSTPLAVNAQFGSTVVTDNFVLNLAPSTPQTLYIDGSNFHGHNSGFAVASNDFTWTTPGALTIDDCDFNANATVTDYSLTGSGGFFTAFRSKFISGGLAVPVISILGSSTVTINDSSLIGGSLTSIAGVPGAIQLTRSQVSGSTLNKAGASATFGAIDSSIVSSTVSAQNGSLLLTNCDVRGSTVQGTAARGITFTDCKISGSTVNQNRSNPANTDVCAGLIVAGGSTFTLTGATDAGGVGGPQYTNAEIVNGSTFTCNAPGPAAAQLLNSRIANGSTLNLQGQSARWLFGRVDANSVVNSGNGFVHTQTIIELAGTYTLTANNTNRLANKSFSDII